MKKGDDVNIAHGHGADGEAMAAGDRPGRGARGVLLLASLLVGTAGAASAQSPDHDVLRRLKTVDWPGAYLRQDAAALDTILAPEFRRVDGNGDWFTKADELARVRAARPAYDSLVFEIRRLEVYHGTSAVVAGTGHVFTTVAGRTERSRYQSTNVLVKRDGRWVAVASHTSGARADE